mmetsp:Transcript_12546/g.24485  ORF Transcript_12546/g.24485 Transcript_12546/m.24485 type:complete len:224 (-) Transcript_12546:1756-2427(-)
MSVRWRAATSAAMHTLQQALCAAASRLHVHWSRTVCMPLPLLHERCQGVGRSLQVGRMSICWVDSSIIQILCSSLCCVQQQSCGLSGGLRDGCSCRWPCCSGRSRVCPCQEEIAQRSCHSTLRHPREPCLRPQGIDELHGWRQTGYYRGACNMKLLQSPGSKRRHCGFRRSSSTTREWRKQRFSERVRNLHRQLCAGVDLGSSLGCRNVGIRYATISSCCMFP